MDFEDVSFPDFDDIAVPPEPNEDSEREKEAEQYQVTGQYLNAEKKCDCSANLVQMISSIRSTWQDVTRNSRDAVGSYRRLVLKQPTIIWLHNQGTG